MVAKAFQVYELLICDDDPRFRETLRMLFEPYFQLIEARCGEEAIDLLRDHPVDLVLLDMHMAVLTGLETLRIVKSILTQLPCILITADATDELRQAAAEAEAFSVLRKPVARRELVQTVAGALELAYNDREIGHWLGAS